MESENNENKIINQEENKEDEENKKNNNNQNEIPKFDEFLNLSYEEFGVNCINCISKFFSNNLYLCSLKIYSKEKFNVEIKVKKKLVDFERLYKLINSKYSKMNLQPFPPFLFTKDEEYMNYFDNLLNDIIRMAKENEEMKIIFLKFLYDFFIEDKMKEISIIKGEIITDMFSKENSKVLKTPKNSKFKISITNIINSYKKENKKTKEKENGKEKEIKKIQELQKDKKKSIDINNDFLNEINIIENEWENILIKIKDEAQFQGYIKILDQCMFICKEKRDDNIEQYFDYIIPLYNINVDIKKNRYGNDNIKNLLYSKSITPKEIFDLYYCDSNTGNMKLSEFYVDIQLTLYHNYSQYYIDIFFGKDNTISQLKNLVEFVENNSYILFLNDINPFPYIKQIDEKYINIYGLLYISIDSLQIHNFSEECFIQITSFPYMFNTKKLRKQENKENKIYKINQKFIIPIHNRFGKIKFEIYENVFKGVLIKSKEHEIIYEASIEITQILNNFNNKEISFNLVFKSLEKETVKRRKNTLLNIIEEDDDNFDQKIKTNISLTIKDYSSPFVLLERNKNKYILEDVEAGDDNLGVKILFKRLRKAFYLFDEFTLLYHSIYQFKYPIFSFLCMLFFFGHLYLIESKYIIKSIITLLIIILISKCQIYKLYLQSYVNKYIFSYKNPYDLKSKIISTKNEIEDRELKNPDYLIEKEELNIISDILDPLTNYNKYKLKYFDFLVKITKIIASVEKIKNLFLWTDPKLTIYFLILLIMAYLILYKIDFKYLIFFSLAKKFFFGFFYYSNKYKNNKEIARILLEHAVQNWRELNNRIDNKFQRLANQIDLSTIRVYDSRFKEIIIDIFEKNSNAVISPTIFNIINSLRDMKNEIGKCEGILKIKKISPLHRFVKKNDKILEKEIEIEDIFFYFIQNIKSDLYILRNKEDMPNINDEVKNVNEDRYLSLSSENFIPKKNNENNEKKKEDKKEVDINKK